MRCTLTREALLGLLEPLTKVTSHRIAGLQNVLLMVRDDYLRVSGTNLEAEIIRVAPVAVDETGATLVHCGRLVSLIRSMGGTDVVLSTDERRLRVQCGAVECFLPIAAPENYRPLPQVCSHWVERVPTRILSHCAQVAYAGRRALEEYGLYLTSIDGQGAVCSTNGQRAAIVLDPEIGLPDVLIPPALMAIFLEGAADTSATADVGVGDVLIYRTPLVSAVIAKSAATIPPFGQWLAGMPWPTATVTVKRSELLELAQRAEFFFASESINRLELTADPSAGVIHAALQSDLGSLNETVGAVDAIGTTVLAGISPTYLRETLVALRAHERVVLNFGATTTDHLRIFPEGDAQQIHIIGQRWGVGEKEAS